MARQSGRPQTFSTMLILVMLWLATGPLFGFSATLMDLEEMADQQLDQLHDHDENLARLAREQLEEPPA